MFPSTKQYDTDKNTKDFARVNKDILSNMSIKSVSSALISLVTIEMFTP